MKNNKNLFISILIVFGFIVAWDALVVSRYGSAPSKNVNPPAAQPLSSPAIQSSAPAIITESQKATLNAPQKSVILISGKTRVELESAGARVQSWKVLEKDHWVEFVYTGEKPKMFPLETYPNLSFGLESTGENKAIYSAALPSGAILRKTLELGANTPLHTLTLEFSNPTQSLIPVKAEIGWGSGINKRAINVETGEVRKDQDPITEMRALALAEHLRQWKPGFIFDRSINIENSGAFKWVGVDNHHFLASFIPASGTIGKILVRADKATAATALIPLDFDLKPQETKTFIYSMYVGPKRGSDLKTIGFGLNESITFGMFGFISKALLQALEYFHAKTGNYGWAIFILTVVLQILVFPLTRKSLDHSIKMRVLQPQLKVLQDQFKSDPKRLQVETLNLYKKNGMHFMGLEGCFPVLLQIPIFFAFYSALNGAFELRGADWIFWIKDLAAPDPYYVLPILMGAGMMLQQKLTTVPTDPMQARMAMIMPVIFVFMFFKMPAGLVLYWTVNSVCTIVIQRILLLKQPSTTPVTRL